MIAVYNAVSNFGFISHLKQSSVFACGIASLLGPPVKLEAHASLVATAKQTATTNHAKAAISSRAVAVECFTTTESVQRRISSGMTTGRTATTEAEHAPHVRNPKHWFDDDDDDLKIDKVTIPQVSSSKFLGTYIDQHLKWTTHITEV